MDLIKTEEFFELEQDKKKKYLDFLYKEIQVLEQQAEKNCSDCFYKITATDAVVIDLHLDDWRQCRNNCDECTKEDQVQMCNLQFEIIDFLANEILRLQKSLRAVAKLSLGGKDLDLFDDMTKDHQDEMIS